MSTPDSVYLVTKEFALHLETLTLPAGEGDSRELTALNKWLQRSLSQCEEPVSVYLDFLVLVGAAPLNICDWLGNAKAQAQFCANCQTVQGGTFENTTPSFASRASFCRVLLLCVIVCGACVCERGSVSVTDPDLRPCEVLHQGKACALAVCKNCHPFATGAVDCTNCVQSVTARIILTSSFTASIHVVVVLTSDTDEFSTVTKSGEGTFHGLSNRENHWVVYIEASTALQLTSKLNRLSLRLKNTFGWEEVISMSVSFVGKMRH